MTVSYTGKTTNIRLRTNQHITECRTGIGFNKFDKHVYNCRRKHNFNSEPYFKLYAFAKFRDESSLLTYESHLHKLGFDTMNKEKAMV